MNVVEWALTTLGTLALLVIVDAQAQDVVCECNHSFSWRALTALYTATNGDSWRRRDNWLVTGSSVCTWYGILCSEIDLRSNGLTGSLPVALSEWTAVTKFSVFNNSITGTLPIELRAWGALNVFELNYNRFYGTLPVAYAVWTSIVHFSAPNNQLSGSIPPEYEAWHSIEVFGVEGCNMSGVLPSGFGSAWPSVKTFHTNANRLAGTIPPSYGLWSKVSSFSAGNLLTGTLPEELSSWKSISVFDVGANRLNGTLPDGFAAWGSSIVSFSVQQNELTGTFPLSLKAWTSLKSFVVFANHFSGIVPVDYSSWTSLEGIDVSSNDLTGTLPSAFGSAWAPSLTVFDVASNAFSGTLSPEYRMWVRMERFEVQLNRLSGSLPSEYGEWRSPSIVDVSNNVLSGTLPPQLSRWGSKLTVFKASQNRLRGKLPASFANWSGVSIVILTNNSLTGTLPDALGEGWAQNIADFHIGHNNFTGVIPASFRLWRRIELFRAPFNRLSGDLPVELSAWGSVIMEFIVHDNNFTGALPPAYSSWTRIRIFNVDHNVAMNGTLPEAYAGWGDSISEFHASWNSWSGTLPGAYRRWSNLQAFRLDQCAGLGGTLPSDYSSWKRLRLLVLRLTQITGTLSDDFSAWNISMEEFTAENNRFHGTLPLSYASWGRVRVVNFGRNYLEGTLPDEYSAWGSALQFFFVHDNGLHGTLPLSYAGWTGMQRFRVDNNFLSGQLPSVYAIAWSTTLSLLIVSSNQLSSTLPREFARCQHLDLFVAQRNSFSGTIPSEFAQISRLRVLALDNNNFSGPLPPLGLVAILTLHNNPNLYGTIPTTMGYSTIVSLCNTSLCGAIPPSWLLFPGTPLETIFACETVLVSFFEKLSFNSDARTIVSPVPAGLLPCIATNAPALPPTTYAPVGNSSSSVSTAAVVSSQVLGGAVMAATSAMSVLQIATGGFGAIGLLQVSLSTRRIALRLQRCATFSEQQSTIVAEDDSDVPGALFVDNPTMMELSGPLAMSRGAVVGNTLLVCISPVVAPVVMWVLQGVYRPHNRDGLERCVRRGVAVFMAGSGMLQVPTSAASGALMRQAKYAENAASAIYGSLGLLTSVLPLAILCACYAQLHPLKGAVLPLQRRSAKRRTIADVWNWLWRPRSSWSWKQHRLRGHRARDVKTSTLSRNAAAGVLSLYLEYALEGCQYPHIWALFVDAGSGVITGVLIGVASSPLTPCEGAQAACWATFGICAALALVTTMARPRSAVGDCVFTALMSLWTAVVVLLTVVGASSSALDAAGVAQAAVQLLWCVPVTVQRFRARNKFNNNHHINNNSVEHPQHRRDIRVTRFSRASNDALHRLVNEICTLQQRRQLRGDASPGHRLHEDVIKTTSADNFAATRRSVTLSSPRHSSTPARNKSPRAKRN